MKKQRKHSFTFADVSLEPRHQIGLHRQHSWELSYVSVGAGERTIGDVSMHFGSGDVVLIPPEIRHCWHFNDDVTDNSGRIANITVTFDNTFLSNCASSFPELSTTIMHIQSFTDAIIFDKEQSADIIILLNKMKTETEQERIATLIRLLIIISRSMDVRIVGSHRTTDRTTQTLNNIRTYVVCNYSRAITISDIARYVGMNRSSFCIFFRQNTGNSFTNYLNEYRIEKACEHLRRMEVNISEICYRSGFNDVPYFNRTFRRIKGMSPRQYRQANGNDS
jgi:YesN/AraC family two-component response regulator